jgi:hypothetical protein
MFSDLSNLNFSALFDILCLISEKLEEWEMRVQSIDFLLVPAFGFHGNYVCRQRLSLSFSEQFNSPTFPAIKQFYLFLGVIEH